MILKIYQINSKKNRKSGEKNRKFLEKFPKNFDFFHTFFDNFFEFLEYFFRSKISGENRVFLLENCDFFARKKFSIENFKKFSSTFFFKFFSNITSGFQRCRISSFIRNKQLFRNCVSFLRKMSHKRHDISGFGFSFQQMLP